MSLCLDEIKDLVRVHLGAKKISPEDRIYEDLGAESADVVNIIAALEDRYQIRIDEEEIGEIKTVGDLVELTLGRYKGK